MGHKHGENIQSHWGWKIKAHSSETMDFLNGKQIQISSCYTLNSNLKPMWLHTENKFKAYMGLNMDKQFKATGARRLKQIQSP